MTQEKNNAVAKLLSIQPYELKKKKDEMKLVTFKMRESEIEAFREFCEVSGVKQSDVLRDFVQSLINK